MVLPSVTRLAGKGYASSFTMMVAGNAQINAGEPTTPTANATPAITPIPIVTATPEMTSTDIGSGGGAVTTASPTIPATGSNPSPLAPIGLSAILVGVALLGLVAIRRAKDTRLAS